MSLKNILLAGTAATAITVIATDSHAQTRQNAGVFNWSGFYLGGHIGYGRAKTTGILHNDGSFPLFQEDLKLRNVLGGIHLGYNIQRGAMVYGLEGDLSFMRFKDSRTDAPSSNTENLSTRVNMLASVRARLGIAVNRGLFYGTGGIAIPRVKSSIYNSGDQGHYRFNKIGGVLGVGYEWAATNQWRWRMEALHYVFNEKKDISNLHSGNPGEAYRLKNATTIRLGISRYFSY